MAEFPAENLIAEIEARQADALQQLEELNGRIEQAILHFSPQQHQALPMASPEIASS